MDIENVLKNWHWWNKQFCVQIVAIRIFPIVTRVVSKKLSERWQHNKIPVNTETQTTPVKENST